MPHPMKPSSRAALVETVGNCIEKVLRKTLADEDKRMDIALEVCDEVLREIDKKGEKNEFI
tara:strand:- start:5909 stop:6091 length:183 start_codon:yes stop_codon:yes gene_type:complete